jgi:hypothetical protein
MTLKITDNIPDYIKFLKKRHGALQLASAETVNTAAKIIDNSYRTEVKKFTLRNQFTMGAIRLLPATAKRSSGEFRKIEKINAYVGVRKMRGGKDHYLKKQEEGAKVSGKGGTLGAVPVPLDPARMSEAHNRPIKGPLRLQNAKIQTLSLGGQPFGIGDRYSPRQRWSILYKYSGRSNSGRPAGRDQGWNLKVPFFFQGIRRGLGVFQLSGDRFKMLRTLEKKSISVTPRHGLQKAVRKLTPGIMEMIFKRAVLKHPQ